MKRIIILAALAIGLPGVHTTLRAQDYNDLVFYSQGQATGTARNLATGGALNAIGGDLSTMASNPAGMGLLRQYNAYVSGGMGLFIGREDFRGVNTRETKPFGSFDGIGANFHFGGSAEQTTGLVGVNFGVAYNKLADYSYKYTAEGITDGATFLDALAQEANDTKFPPFPSRNDAFKGYNWYLALARPLDLVEPRKKDGKLMDKGDPPSEFDRYKVPWLPGERALQINEVNSTGKSSEVNIGLGFNISNRLFAGIALGIPSIRRSWTQIYTEKAADEPKDLISYEFMQEASMEANGINLKLGLHGRPVEMLQLGFSIETPSFMQATSKSQLFGKSYFLNGNTTFFNDKSPQSRFEYSFVSPLKAGASIAFIIPEGGFIGLDYRMTATPLAQFTSARFTQDNRNIQSATRYTHALNLGGELLIEFLAIRLGGGYQMNPYKAGYDNPIGQSYHAAGGIGIALPGFWLDLSYRHLFQEGYSPLYSYGDIAALSKHKGQQTLLMATVGFNL
ncbi:MAG: hypothetical protein CSA07_03205 [Bacteroidia bacterium]|nr:MAG: hypothetical protein CSA07_03205 [Bacteroidia bacterium]